MIQPIHPSLPEPLKIPRESTLHQGVYGSNLLYPVEALANALSCPINDPSQLHTTVVSLYKKCAIRFGIPSDAPRSMAEAAELPKNPSLRYGPRHAPTDERWARLARALEITAPNTPISLRVLSPEHMVALTSDARELATMFEKSPLSRVGANIVAAFTEIADDIRANSRHSSENIKNLIETISESAFRQLRIAVEVGPEWTLVTPEENLILSSEAARRPKCPSEFCRTNKEEQPSDNLLAPLHLSWKWKDDRGAWEPAFKGSKKHKSTLFDQSVTYFSELLHRDVAQTWNPHTTTFLENLMAAREEFQLARHKQPWAEAELKKDLLVQQNRLLDELLDRRHGTPIARQ